MKRQRLVIGLGNPGIQYANTRHNFGFMVLDEVARQVNLSFKKSKKFQAEIIEGKNYILAKPDTYMNLSGDSVGKIVSFYKLKPADVLVIHDEIDLPLGSLRTRTEGSSGGHRGIESIIQAVGDKFLRLRLGIGPNQNRKAESFVLEQFEATDKLLVDKTIREATTLTTGFIEGMFFEPKTINTKIEKGP